MKSHPAAPALLFTLLATVPAIAQDTPGASAAPAAQPAPAAVAAPTYSDTQLLEEFGWYIGKRTGLSELGLTPAESDVLVKGILASLNGKDSPYEIQKIGPAMTEFIQKKQTAILDTIKTKNQGQNAAFFKTLDADKTIQKLPDGLRYQITNPGTGNPPKPTDTVKVNYTGTLIDGNVFDSSERAGKPAEFQLNQVIPGWTEGMQKIGKGGKIKLYVPPTLGYGDDGRPGIPPGAVLIFDVELVDITPAAGAPESGAAK